MKSFLFKVAFFCFFSASFYSQNILQDNAAYQQTMQFDNLNKVDAINQFLSKNDLNSNNSFIAKEETSDPSGMVHQRNQQYYKGLLVEFGTFITHSSNGFVKSINGELYNASNLNIIPTLSERSCFQLVLDNVNANKYLWEDASQSEIVGYKNPTGQLVILPNVKTGVVNLTYKFDIYSIDPIARQEIYIDAHSGKILYTNPIIKHAESYTFEKSNAESDLNALVPTTANTKYSGARTMETSFNSTLNMWVLNDTTRGNGIVTYNCQNIVNTYQNVHFQDNDNVWTAAEHANANLDNAAQDCHWGSEMTYDFWKNIFNRNSYDNNNAQIRSYMHYRPTTAAYSNAFWNGSFMTYGDGISKPFSSIDICAHEIGHAVCTNTANLAYQNQSGAMNEGFSDIWGACIEHYGRTGSLSGTPVANVWRIGEDVVTGALRSMSSPNTKGDPDTFQGTNWIPTADDGSCVPTSTNDRCGVHTNSGVLNRWFYVLSIGASGTNNALVVADRDTYNVIGIGMIKAAQIAFFAERDYLTPNATYFDMRSASIAVANSLYCSSSPEVIAVTNAWNSVNIGDKHIAYANDISLKNISVSAPVNCETTSFIQPIVFENLGTTSISSVNVTHNIDGGTNVITPWTGSITTCNSGSINLNINTSGLSRGTHVLNVTISTTGDGNTTNNSKVGSIFVNNLGTVNSINTFENANDVLVSYNQNGTNDVWQRGTSAKSTLTNAIAGSKVYATNLNDIYPANAQSYLVSQCYDLSTFANPILKFDMAFDIEYNADVLFMQYSTNGGSTWSLLGSESDPNWYTSNLGCSLCVGGEWTGEADITNVSGTTNGTKRQYSKSLTALGSPTNAIFRFVFQSDSLNELDGVIIDNFVIENALSNNNVVFNNLSIFPNPVSNILKIEFETKYNDDIKIQILDIQGRIVKNSKFDQLSGFFNQTIDLSEFPKGFYLLKISQGVFEYNTKIIKQ